MSIQTAVDAVSDSADIEHLCCCRKFCGQSWFGVTESSGWAIMSLSSEEKLGWIRILLGYLVAGCPWASDFTSLSFTTLTYKTEHHPMPRVALAGFKATSCGVADPGRHSGGWIAVVPPGFDLPNCSAVFAWKLDSPSEELRSGFPALALTLTRP